jgi:hypothetical protein
MKAKVRVKEEHVLDNIRKPAKIGPSDTSDTIADRPGELDTDTDAAYTGERTTAGIDPHGELNVEFDVDRVVDARDAGLGGGLDEAEEAILGVTDEELGLGESEDGPDPLKKPKP